MPARATHVGACESSRIRPRQRGHGHCLQHRQPSGDPFTILGIPFDTKLHMGLAINACVCEVSWRARSLLLSRKFYNDAEMIVFFESHILSLIEYMTPAIYHASTTALRPLERFMQKFLAEVSAARFDLLDCFRIPV